MFYSGNKVSREQNQKVTAFCNLSAWRACILTRVSRFGFGYPSVLSDILLARTPADLIFGFDSTSRKVQTRFLWQGCDVAALEMYLIIEMMALYPRKDALVAEKMLQVRTYCSHPRVQKVARLKSGEKKSSITSIPDFSIQGRSHASILST